MLTQGVPDHPKVRVSDHPTINGQGRSDGNSVDVFRPLGAGNTPLSTVADVQLVDPEILVTCFIISYIDDIIVL